MDINAKTPYQLAAEQVIMNWDMSGNEGSPPQEYLEEAIQKQLMMKPEPYIDI